MDINAYLLNGVAEATTPPGETAANAQSRREAISEMFRGYDPAGTEEAMIACQCIKLHFLSNSTMRDANNTRLPLDDLSRARTGAISTSRTLHQWVTKLERIKQRKEARAAEALKAARANAVSGSPPVAEPMAANAPAAPALKAPLIGTRTEAPPDQQPVRPDTAVLDHTAPIGDGVRPSAGSPGAPLPGLPTAAVARSHVGQREAMPVWRNQAATPHRRQHVSQHEINHCAVPAVALNPDKREDTCIPAPRRGEPGLLASVWWHEIPPHRIARGTSWVGGGDAREMDPGGLFDPHSGGIRARAISERRTLPPAFP